MKRFLIFFSLFIFSTILYAGSINRIIFLGDSLTDNGNLYVLLNGYFPEFPPYYDGRFSNGIVWSERVGKYYYSKADESFKNYALGGATAQDNSSMPELALSAEVQNYLDDSTSDSRPNDLISIWIGPNDYLNDKVTNVDTLSTNVVAAVSRNISKLITEGAKHFIIFDLPNIGDTPFGTSDPEIGKRLSSLTKLHNTKLDNLVAELKTKYPNNEFILISISDFWSKFLKDPDAINKKYGVNIQNTKEACLQVTNRSLLSSRNLNVSNGMQQALGTSPDLAIAELNGNAYQQQAATHCAKPDEYVFWDSVHPTQVVHKVIAKFVIEELKQYKVDL